MDINVCNQCESFSNPNSPSLFISQANQTYCISCFLIRTESEALGELGVTTETICRLHKKPFELYCSTCKALLCSKCIIQHKTHELLDIDETISICEQLSYNFKENFILLQRNADELRDYILEIEGIWNKINNFMNLYESDDCESTQIDVYTTEKNKAIEYYTKVNAELEYSAIRDYRMLQEITEKVLEGVIESLKKVCESINIQKEIDLMTDLELIYNYQSFKSKLEPVPQYDLSESCIISNYEDLKHYILMHFRASQKHIFPIFFM